MCERQRLTVCCLLSSFVIIVLVGVVCVCVHIICVLCQPQQLPLTGHAARAVISTERRLQIWEQFYVSFKETLPPYKWCTRQELVAAACSGETSVKFTLDELTEVIRGRKHKREAGVDSQKVDGEWLYRYTAVHTW